MKEKETNKQPLNRRGFLKGGALLAGSALTPATNVAGNDCSAISEKRGGETLYNGIRLPETWPPTGMVVDAYDPMPVPYLVSPPKVIPIDVGRQLFVDDFLIEKTTAARRFHQPTKYAGNPLVSPQSEWEMNDGACPVAAPFSDGVFYDPADSLFKMWYMAGWLDYKTALATSADGLHWTRPELDVIRGSNLVLVTPGLPRDGASVWLDHEAADPSARFKLYIYVREGQTGQQLRHEGGRVGGYQYTSADGVHWNLCGKTEIRGDNGTFFYNPFRRKWVFSLKRARPAQPWSTDPVEGPQRPPARARNYWENADYLAAVGGWKDEPPVFWLGADRLDERRDDYPIGREPQLYKLDAAGYESLMIGLVQLHYGPPNDDCARGGFPKLTELQLAFSRDGFHWDRSNRETFIGASLQRGSWERAYVHSVGGVCNIVGDKLFFYYSAFMGDENRRTPHYDELYSGMYANASVGLAVLRRDGFASMEAGSVEKMLLTRACAFSGSFLFVNIDTASEGQVQVELCDQAGAPLPGFTRDDCIPLSGDSTRQFVRWRDNASLQSLAGTPIRFKFHITDGKLYAFWISKTNRGESGGATAAGGPGMTSTWDI